MKRLILVIPFALALAMPLRVPVAAQSQTNPLVQTNPLAQAAPAASAAHPDFSGTWVIDRGISGDPQQVTFEPTPQQQQQHRGGGGGGRGGFGGGGGGYRRGGFGGGSGNSGGSRPSEQSSSSETPTADERARLQALTDVLKTASGTLVISHHDPDFVVTDSKKQTQSFKTDGNAAEAHVGTATMASAARWYDTHLVIAYALDEHHQLVYTYTVLPATKQMVLRVRRDVDGRQSPNAPELKLVYTLSTSNAG
jgi:hypothetical protein